MNKRNKLRFTASDSFNLTRDASIILNPRLDSEDMRKEETLDHGSAEVSSETSMQTEPPEPQSTKDVLLGVISRIRAYWIYVSLAGMMAFLVFRPSEYSFLLDEIHRLREENRSIRMLKPMENICDITKGALVGAHSKLYRFGLLDRLATDPNSLMEPGNSLLAIKSPRGFFEIRFKDVHSIKKIGFYHPAFANPSSAIREFSIVVGGKEIDCEYQGYEYQEFLVDDAEDSKITIVVKSNHGEPRYTSVYRMFVFA